MLTPRTSAPPAAHLGELGEPVLLVLVGGQQRVKAEAKQDADRNVVGRSADRCPSDAPRASPTSGSAEQEGDAQPTPGQDADHPERRRDSERVEAERENEREELGDHEVSVGKERLTRALFVAHASGP